MTQMNRYALPALILAMAPALVRADPPAPSACPAKPAVTVAIAPFDLAYPPEKPERLYPAAARQAQISGHVTLECNAKAGKLENCAIDDETPTDQGFGASALKLAKTLEVITPATAQIVKVDIQYDVTPSDGPCKGRS
jgi:TonB family protein